MNTLAAGMRFEREIRIDARELAADSRTVPATLSSETPVKRWFGTEILSHDPGAIDLSRAADGLPLLWNHDHGQPIGIVENVRVKDGTLKGRLRFSSNPKAREIFQDVREGFIQNVSIGYSVDRWEQAAGSDDVTVTGWTLLEASVVTVPADATAGINRSLPGVPAMSDDTKPIPTGDPSPSLPVAAPVVELSRAQAIARQAGADQAIKNERSRISGIDALFTMGAVRSLAPDVAAGLRVWAIDNGKSVDDTRAAILDALSGDAEPMIDYVGLSDRPAATRALPTAPALSLIHI